MQVIAYRKEDGTEPAMEYINGLNDKLQAKTFRTLSLLMEYGKSLPMPHSRPLGNGIFELRTKQGNDITRILYFFYIGDIAILTNGFTKKTQKTPRKEIEKAVKYKEDFLRRYKQMKDI